MQAFQSLHKEKLIYKQVKKWIVGMRTSSRSRRAHAASSPAVILLLAGQTDWDALFNNAHTVPFSSAFSNEAVKFGHKLIPVLRNAVAGTTLEVACGSAAYRSLVQALGDDYRGTLMLADDVDKKELSAWVHEMLLYGRPIVCVACSGSEPSPVAISRAASRSYYLYFDHAAAVQCALNALAQNGHRSIALPGFGAGHITWVERRIALCRAFGAKLSPPAHISTVDLNEQFWCCNYRTHELVEPRNSFANRVLTTVNRPRMKQYSFRKLLLKATSSMVSLLKSGTISALMCPNDAMATDLYTWCRHAGIEIPRHLSMISFGNIPESVMYPITTVDFGLDRLGYLAAHAFIGDIAIKAGKNGEIGSVPTLIDRGSVAVHEASTTNKKRLH